MLVHTVFTQTLVKLSLQTFNWRSIQSCLLFPLERWLKSLLGDYVTCCLAPDLWTFHIYWDYCFYLVSCHKTAIFRFKKNRWIDKYIKYKIKSLSNKCQSKRWNTPENRVIAEFRWGCSSVLVSVLNRVKMCFHVCSVRVNCMWYAHNSVCHQGTLLWFHRLYLLLELC